MVLGINVFDQICTCKTFSPSVRPADLVKQNETMVGNCWLDAASVIIKQTCFTNSYQLFEVILVNCVLLFFYVPFFNVKASVCLVYSICSTLFPILLQGRTLLYMRGVLLPSSVYTLNMKLVHSSLRRCKHWEIDVMPTFYCTSVDSIHKGYIDWIMKLRRDV